MAKIIALIQITILIRLHWLFFSQQAHPAAHKKSVFDGAGVPPTGEKEDGDRTKIKQKLSILNNIRGLENENFDWVQV